MANCLNWSIGNNKIFKYLESNDTTVHVKLCGTELEQCLEGKLKF